MLEDLIFTYCNITDIVDVESIPSIYTNKDSHVSAVQIAHQDHNLMGLPRLDRQIIQSQIEISDTYARQYCNMCCDQYNYILNIFLQAQKDKNYKLPTTAISSGSLLTATLLSMEGVNINRVMNELKLPYRYNNIFLPTLIEEAKNTLRNHLTKLTAPISQEDLRKSEAAFNKKGLPGIFLALDRGQISSEQ